VVKSLGTSLVARGFAVLAVGVIALAWPGVTAFALVVLFAADAFIAAGRRAVRASGSATAGPVAGRLLPGLAGIAAGVVALSWPGPAALVLALIAGGWAIIAGLAEIAAAVRAGGRAGTRALFVPGGLAPVAVGVVLCARPGPGAVTRALLFGLFTVVCGARALVQGIERRRTGTALSRRRSSVSPVDFRQARAGRP
jgi:uncharacterized membrane protein HdeD (DUF308 family)